MRIRDTHLKNGDSLIKFSLIDYAQKKLKLLNLHKIQDVIQISVTNQ